MRFFLLLALGASLFAADTKPVDPPKPPTLSEAQLHKFWRTQAEANQAQAVAKTANDTFQAVIEDLRKSCSPNFNLAIDVSGEPSCASKPPETAVTPATKK